MNDQSKIETPISTNVLVVGAGPEACAAAQELSRMGHGVLLLGPESEIAGHPAPLGGREHDPCDLESIIKAIKDDPRIEIMAPGEIIEFEGFPGEFRVRLKGAETPGLLKEVGAVILANETVLWADFEAWGVKESERIRSLSWLESLPANSSHLPVPSAEEPLRAVFLCGFTHHSNPITQKRAMGAAIRLASKLENQVFFITEHLKVAHAGMERLSREAREKGVLFTKLTTPRPRMEADAYPLDVSYYDEALGEEVSLSPHLVILEETVRPSPDVASIAERLNIHLDENGFFQCENIYNLPIYTNRVGIWAVGPARGTVALGEGIEEAKAAALDVHRLLEQGRECVAEKQILLDTKRCTICLTCYRLCPHSAITYLNRRPVFSPLACKLCGICAAECPMDAIQLHDWPDQRMEEQLMEMMKAEPVKGGEGVPVIFAFCCRNSALEAARLAHLRGLPLPGGLRLLEIPCAGRIDPDHLLKAFRVGADGVMVLGCHRDSCKSFNGNELAESRVESMKAYLSDAGLEEERLYFGNLAPGMSMEFVKMAGEMEEILMNLGRSPLSK
ncbi:MAG: hydrogenase iron-sulfur subunit [Pseudomonadota bacterium]